jgi:hypothetical protein
VTCWTTAKGNLHWANITAPLRLLDWEGWVRAPWGSAPQCSTPTPCSV